MIHLLRSTSVFTPLPNLCCRQICGDPVYEQPPLFTDANMRHKDADGINTNKLMRPLVPPSPSNTLLHRSFIYYSNPTKQSTENACSGVSAGRTCATTVLERRVLTEASDILNTLTRAFPQAYLPEYVHDMAMARHLSKHIWPRQYGMTASEPSCGKGRRLREEAIMQAGAQDTPLRLRLALSWLMRMTIAHQHLDSETLKTKFCPSTVSSRIYSCIQKLA